ncbi:MAG TPA: BON domain-containing protein [Gammaproteobacteria bacterium]|nr:BON domain-containing protein [Gammaproteobacteria bacterium]
MNMQWIQKLRGYAVIFLMSVFFPVLVFASSGLGNTISDTLITGKVKSDLAINAITSDQQISVTTNDGVVTLSGSTDSQTQATAAIQITQATDGVKSVNASQLRVRTSHQPYMDAYITAKVKIVLLIHGVSATVETENGVVYLSGFVKSSAQSQNAVQLARAVGGVVSVKSDLAVKS